MAKRADKLLENLLKAHDKGNLAELSQRMAGGFLAPPPSPTLSPVLDDVQTSVDSAPTAPIIPATKPAHEPDNDPDNEPDNTSVLSPFNDTGNEPVHKPDHSPVHEPVYEPEYEPVSEPVKIIYPVNQPVRDVSHKPSYYPANDPAISPANESVNRPDHDPVIHPVNTRSAPIDPELWYPFTEKQGKVLLYLIGAGGISNRQHIADDTGVNIATVKHTLRILTSEGYIGQIKLYANHTQRGFTYNINPQLCNEYAERLKSYPVNYPVRNRVNNPVKAPFDWPQHKPVKEPAKIQPVPFSSSDKQKTTTDENPVLNGPEMAYWEEQGVREPQAKKWCAEFETSPEELRQQLAWARWDLLENGKEAEVRDPLNWFYGVLKKTAGCYPPAKGYQSPAMLRAQRMKAQLEAEDQARKELDAVEQESRFRGILADPSGLAYQQLLASADSFAREQGGKTLEKALRGIFQRQEAG